LLPHPKSSLSCLSRTQPHHYSANRMWIKSYTILFKNHDCLLKPLCIWY
jgi:hypothetical protein